MGLGDVRVGPKALQLAHLILLKVHLRLAGLSPSPANESQSDRTGRTPADD
jgi:hypothetical protein